MYYVVVIRFVGDQEKDVVYLMDRDMAVERGWINEEGDRIWLSPSLNQTFVTSVFEFDNISKAFTFATTFANSELGIKTEIGT